MANLTYLQHYLSAGIPVDNPAHGQGVLRGLPWMEPWDEQKAEVRFPHDGGHQQCYELATITPVLYAPADLSQLLNLLTENDRPAEWKELLCYHVDELEFYARVVDAARALGVALNVPPSEYIRRFVTRPVLPTEPQPLPPAPGQMSLF